MSEPKLEKLRRISAANSGLCTFVCLDESGSPHASVINAGVMTHPLTGETVVAAVVMGSARKVVMLRADPRVAVTFRHDWDWVGVRGLAQVIGLDDPADGFDVAQLPALLREVFQAAGGTHDNWDEYDQAMATGRRAAVFVSTDKVTSNPGSIG